MKCSNCGNILSANAKFCTKCGYSVAYGSGGKVCPNCGNKVSANAAFCNSCGVSLTDSVPAEPVSHPEPSPEPNNDTYIPQPSPQPIPQPKPPMPKKSGAVVAIVVAAVLFGLAVLAGLGYLAYHYVYELDVFDLFDNAVVVDFDDNDDIDDRFEEQNEEEISTIDSSVISNIISQNSSYTDFGIYVHNLKTGYGYGYNSDTSFLASAMGQVVILETISDLANEYGIDMAEEEVYFSYLANGKEAPDSKYQNGKWLSLSECVEDVAVYGDNNKSNLLVDYIANYGNGSNGFYVINDRLAGKGYTNTKINRKTYVNTSMVDYSVPANTTTPYEIGCIFEDLINHSSIGSKAYMMNIFKSLNPDGSPIGLKKYIPDQFTSCSANALTTASTNDVAIISDGETEIVVAILSTTKDGKTDVEDNAVRENVQHELLRYIIDTQF